MAVASIEGAIGRRSTATYPLRAAALEIDRLEKRYGEVVAVAGISLRVERGEVFGFLGPNGAGKTTTIGMALGLLAPSGGSVRLFGEPLAGRERALLRRVGALVETPTFYPYLGGRDNLRAVALASGGVHPARIEETLALVRLTAVAGRPYRTYSLGMKQRLGIGAALLADPDLVILDEPTNGLDPAGIIEIRHLLRDLADQGKAVFLSSHQLNEVQQICDRVAIVNQGAIVAEGSVAELLRDQRVTSVTVSDPVAAFDLVRSLPWVRSARLDGDACVVTGDPPDAFALGAALARSGIWIGHLTRREGTLERLFIRLTTGDGVEHPDGVATNGHQGTLNGW
jgi:ABC-2 type transport system ATP-binding protein